ncbi:hypothetical protein VWZ88_01740 [Phaeobacter sp. JH20_36]|uniref:hypothetical protein n=1 Tax=unclassified Phaeobacter TaxID=2621772 RepID=UPI003A8A93B3
MNDLSGKWRKPVKINMPASKIFDETRSDPKRIAIWLEQRVLEYCARTGKSLNEASEESGNSRSFLSGLFKKGGDVGVCRFLRICHSLQIEIDEQALGIALGRRPTIDEVTDIVADGATTETIAPILDYLVIYAEPPHGAETLKLLHIGPQSLAARVIESSSLASLQKAVDSFPYQERQKLIMSYQLAAKGTCLISMEKLSSHIHGQPGAETIRYKRLLFPIQSFNGVCAVGVHASATSRAAKPRTSLAVE